MACECPSEERKARQTGRVGGEQRQGGRGQKRRARFQSKRHAETVRHEQCSPRERHLQLEIGRLAARISTSQTRKMRLGQTERTGKTVLRLASEQRALERAVEE